MATQLSLVAQIAFQMGKVMAFTYDPAFGPSPDMQDPTIRAFSIEQVRTIANAITSVVSGIPDPTNTHTMHDVRRLLDCLVGYGGMFDEYRMVAAANTADAHTDSLIRRFHPEVHPYARYEGQFAGVSRMAAI